MAEKLVDRRDVINRIVNDIFPKYFTMVNVDKNRLSIFGYLAESEGKSIEDTVLLEQKRAEDYCPELSTNEIHVRQTAQIRQIGIQNAVPANCYVQLNVIKDDVHRKGKIISTLERQLIIDKRSVIMNNGIPFSLEDDILIREVVRKDGSMVYTANYTGMDRAYDSYIQVFDDVNDEDEGIISLILMIYQRSYNIQEKTVTNELDFMYDGIDFDYDNYLAGFDVYYKQSYSDTFKKAELRHHLTNDPDGKYFYYDNDDMNILTIMNNPLMRVGANAVIRVEIQETLGADGMTAIGTEETTFELFRDNAYDYSGIYIEAIMLSDPVNASSGDDIKSLKHRLILEKTMRKNITTMIDILNYIDDIGANVQIIKKRNDVQDRHYYLYTLMRGPDNEIMPTTTKTFHFTSMDFDIVRTVSNRKGIKSNNKFQLHIIEGERDSDYVTMVHDDDVIDPLGFYVNLPFLIIMDKYNVMYYYFNSVDQTIPVNTVRVNDQFPYQVIAKEVHIYRNALQEENDDQYIVQVEGTLNTSNDIKIVDEGTGEILDYERIIAYVMFKCDGIDCAYLPMRLINYNPERSMRSFTFEGRFRTSDFITELGFLEITEGLKEIGTGKEFDSVIDYKNGLFEVGFLYNETGDDSISESYDPGGIYAYIPGIEKYTWMNVYGNTQYHPYDLIIELNRYSRSPVKINNHNSDVGYYYTAKEVPFVEFNYARDHIMDIYHEVSRMFTIYTTMVKKTTDFDISVKFIATYGQSKYIQITGGRDENGEEIIRELKNLNPTFRFRVYGNNVDLQAIHQYIYEYLRDTYITPDNMEDTEHNDICRKTIFISNICTDIETMFPKVRSIKYLGVDQFDASYQQFTYMMPVFKDVDGVMRYIPEQLNVTNIEIDIDET